MTTPTTQLIAEARAKAERMDVTENSFTGPFPLYCGRIDYLGESPCSEPLEPMCSIHPHKGAKDERYDVEAAVAAFPRHLDLLEAVLTDANGEIREPHEFIAGGKYTLSVICAAPGGPDSNVDKWCGMKPSDSLHHIATRAAVAGLKGNKDAE